MYYIVTLQEISSYVYLARLKALNGVDVSRNISVYLIGKTKMQICHFYLNNITLILPRKDEYKYSLDK